MIDMLWKTLLLMLLCVPLGYRAWIEFDAHEDNAPRAVEIVVPDAPEPGRSLDERQNDARLFGNVLTVGDEAATDTTGRMEASARAQRPHAAKVRVVRAFTRAYHDLERDPDRVPDLKDVDLNGLLKTRAAFIKDRLREETRLDAVFVALKPDVAKALSTRSSAQLETALTRLKVLDQGLTSHLGKCATLPLLESRAVKSSARTVLRRDLTALAIKDVFHVDASDKVRLEAHLREYAKLLASTREPDLQSMVRDEAYRFCENCLPTTAPKDDMVLFRPTEEAPRAEIRGHYAEGTAERRAFEEGRPISAFGASMEFDPPPPMIAFYTRVGGGSTNDRIRPTVKNHFAHWYEKNRKGLQWNVESLDRFILGYREDYMDRYKSKELPETSRLPVLYRRLETLRFAMNKKDDLFPTSTPAR